MEILDKSKYWEIVHFFNQLRPIYGYKIKAKKIVLKKKKEENSQAHCSSQPIWNFSFQQHYSNRIMISNMLKFIFDKIIKEYNSLKSKTRLI